jgi:chemotaxis protein MotB
MNNAANIGDTGLEKAPHIQEDDFFDPSDEWMMAAAEMLAAIADFTDDREGGDLVITLEVTEAYIIIRCKGEVLFDTLSDRLRPDGAETLGFIVDSLIMPQWDRGIVSEVRIEGYADERPVQRGTSRFEDNLVLSTFRAVAAYRYIVTNYDIPPRSVSPSGYGDTRPLERLEGETREEWLSRNRRVEFVLMRNFLLDEETGQGYTRNRS